MPAGHNGKRIKLWTPATSRVKFHIKASILFYIYMLVNQY